MKIEIFLLCVVCLGLGCLLGFSNTPPPKVEYRDKIVYDFTQDPKMLDVYAGYLGKKVVIESEWLTWKYNGERVKHLYYQNGYIEGLKCR